MFHFFEAITNTKGDALIGYYVKAVDTASGSVVDIYADESSTPIVSVSGIANAAKVDSDGNASFYVAGGTYHLDIYATDATTFIRRIHSLPMVDATIAAGNVATRASLQAVVAASGDARTLVESGREGTFVFDTSDLSAKVTADTNQGIYIPPTSDTTGASGAWVRQVNGDHNAAWFGFSTANSGATNKSILQGILDYFLAIGQDSSGGAGTPYRGAPRLFIPSGIYNMVGAVDVNATVHIQGDGSGTTYGGAPATELKWNDTSSGFRIQRINTSGDTTYDAVSHGGGDGTTISNICLDGGTAATYVAGTEAGDYHGIHFKARFEAHNVLVRNWAGNGFHANAVAGSASSTEGNANNWRLLGCSATNCRNGIYLDGADTNAGYSMGFNGVSNRQWGIYDSSFLSNHHLAFHLDSNGFEEMTYAHVSGHIYYCLVGQETWCSTNAPTGAISSNQGWIYSNEGGVGNRGARTWTTGLTWRAGGPIVTDNANASHVISGYIEGGQAPAMLTVPTMVLGGQLGSAKNYGTTTDYGGYLLAANSGLKAAGPLQVSGVMQIDAGIKFGGNGNWSSGHRIFQDSTHGLALYTPTAGASNDLIYGNSSGSTVLTNPTGTLDLNLAGNFNVASSKVYKVNATQVVGARITGWAAATNTKSKATFDTTTVTLPQLASRVGQLIDDLMTHGLIGT